MELTVHIGTGKTGSSSIQRTLAKGHQALAAKGIWYVGLMFEMYAHKQHPWQKTGGWPLLVHQDAAQARSQLAEVLLGTLEAAAERGVRRVVWSNESIFGNHALVLPVLHEAAERGVHVRVIVYLRRHDAWVQSAYLQWGVKHKTYRGPVKPFRDWYGSGGKANFYSGLQPWLDGPWSDLAVRNFDACPDVVTDFLSYLGVETATLEITRENETPNAVALALWAMHNSQSDEPVLPVELQALLRRAGLLDAAPRGCNWSALLPSHDDIERVSVDAQTDRQQLDEVLAQHGQPPIDTSPLKKKNLTVSQDEINAAFLIMIRQQAQQIETLRKKIVALEARDAAPSPGASADSAS